MTAHPDLTSADRPLAGLRIVDLVDGGLAPLSRYLAELGARVDRVDAVLAAQDEAFLAANAGKHLRVGAASDPEISALIEGADAVVVSASVGIDLASLRAARPRLVTMTVSDFGADNPLSDWRATDLVLHALSGELSRSGIRGRAPLAPPGDLAMQCAAAQGAYALTAALYHALRTGEGDHVDFSALEGAVQALDPGYGVSGSATMGKPANLLSRDRPAKGFQYPILRCADGYVRLCLLARRQWQGMFRWMGEPAEFAAPEFEQMVVRYKSPRLLPAIAAFFADKPRAKLEAEGQLFGVPISAVLTLEEYIDCDHLSQRGAVRSLQAVGGALRLPNGVVSVDGERMGAEINAGEGWRIAPTAASGGRIFEGLKVLDLGVIVVGAEQGRLFGDQGADVLKVESRAYPDGNRQSYLSYGLSVSFAAGHRNKRSLGINLRDPEGRALFLELAAQADVILSNFKPGTLEGLGLGPADIEAINPRIVMADSSAFGATGPWSGRMGYGPLVRAATGLTLAWRYRDDAEGFSDSVTIYPDHVAARVGAMAVTALLIRRLRTGRGGLVSVAQSEVMLSHFAAQVARVSRGREAEPARVWPWGVYPAAGDDEWVVVTVRDAVEHAALCGVVGLGPDAALEQVNGVLTEWLADRTSLAAAEALQAAGVPAAPMLRVADLPQFPAYRDRAFYRVERHPYLIEDVVAERYHAKSLRPGDAVQNPAPLAGEHSQEVVSDWLGLDADRIAALIEAGVLEPVEARILDDARRAVCANQTLTVDGS